MELIKYVRKDICTGGGGVQRFWYTDPVWLPPRKDEIFGPTFKDARAVLRYLMATWARVRGSRGGKITYIAAHEGNGEERCRLAGILTRKMRINGGVVLKGQRK